MTYQAYEESTFNGSPLELYRFNIGFDVFAYTNGENPVSYLGATYQPTAIVRGEVGQNAAESPGLMSVRVPRDLDIAALFGPFLPSKPVNLTVYRRHQQDPDAQYVPVFIGTVAACNYEDDVAVISAYSLLAATKRRVPWLTYQGNCNWALYNTGCEVSREAFKVTGTVAAINGLDLTASAFSTQPDGWFTAGWVERIYTKEVRFISGHVGGVVSLVSPFPGIAIGEPVYAFAGCMRDMDTCATKFNNLARFAGWPDIPQKNPYADNVYGNGGSGMANAVAEGIIKRYSGG